MTLKGDQHPAQLTAEFFALPAVEPCPSAVDVLMQNMQNLGVLSRLKKDEGKSSRPCIDALSYEFVHKYKVYQARG